MSDKTDFLFFVGKFFSCDGSQSVMMLHQHWVLFLHSLSDSKQYFYGDTFLVFKDRSLRKFHYWQFFSIGNFYTNINCSQDRINVHKCESEFVWVVPKQRPNLGNFFILITRVVYLVFIRKEFSNKGFNRLYFLNRNFTYVSKRVVATYFLNMDQMWGQFCSKRF